VQRDPAADLPAALFQAGQSFVVADAGIVVSTFVPGRAALPARLSVRKRLIRAKNLSMHAAEHG
jgi:hypothetical protein